MMETWSAPRTILEAMAAAAEVADQGFTFADEGGRERSMPFRDVIAEALQHAAAFQSRGLAPGERVALIIPGHQQFIITFLATLAAGLVPVPIYPPFALAKVENWLETTRGILRIARPAAIVTVDEVCPLLWSAAAQVDTLIITVNQLANHTDAAFTPVAIGLDDLAFLQFTSGSTKAPRGVMVSHRNITENCTRIIGEFLQSTAEDKGVSWLPLYHDMGLIGFVLAPLFAVRSVIFLDTIGFLKRPSLWFALIDRHRATVTFAPHFAYALAVRRISAADMANWDLSCLRVVGCGAEPIAAQTLRTFASHFAPAGLRPAALCPCYGLAEATLVVTYTAVGEQWRSQMIDAEHFLKHGEALPPKAEAKTFEFVGCGSAPTGHTLRILDRHGLPVPERTVGEVEFRGPSVTRGYFDDSDATAQSYRDGGLRTGDLGYLADGQLFITGRTKDLIIVRGRKYAPQTIEWALDGLSAVRAGSVVAFAYPSEHGTDQIAIVCEAATHESASIERAVRSRISEELALTVNDVLVLQPGLLPKTSSGKVQRSKTRTLYLDGTLGRIAQTKRPAGLNRQILLARIRWQAGLGWVQYRMQRLRQTRRRNTIKAKS